MEAVVRVRAHVRGRVQGVWYRGSTREQAIAFGVAGWVRNSVDGSVVLEAEGTRDAVTRLVEWCRQGPPMARVDSVEVEDIEPLGAAGSFEITR